MLKTMLVGAIAGAGAFGGLAFVSPRPEAAEEIRCRVNAEALMLDLAALQAKQAAGTLGTEDIKKLLQKK